MSITFEALVGGAATNLNDGSLCWLEANDGLGMAPLHRISDRAPQQHGEMDVGYRLDPRTVRLVLGVDGVTLADLYAKRGRLLKLFRPRLDPIQLRWTFEDGSVRQLDAHYVADMTMPREAGKGYTQTVGLSLRAPDPTFYDPNGEGLSFSMGAGADTFMVPTPVPTGVGTSIVNHTWTFLYDGTWQTFPIVRIQGPINNPCITNDSTGEKLDFAGVSIPAGVAYFIDCRWGQKSVLDTNGVNRIAQLTADSHLATFHIAAEDEAAGGYNTIRATGDGANDQTRVDVVYLTRYLGI